MSTPELIPLVDVTSMAHTAASAAMPNTAMHFLVMRKHAVVIDPMHPAAENERIVVSAEAYEQQGVRLRLVSESLFQTSNTAELMCLERDLARMETEDLALRVVDLQKEIHNLKQQLAQRKAT